MPRYVATVQRPPNFLSSSHITVLHKGLKSRTLLEGRNLLDGPKCRKNDVQSINSYGDSRLCNKQTTSALTLTTQCTHKDRSLHLDLSELRCLTERFSKDTSSTLLGESPCVRAFVISCLFEYCRYTVLPRTCKEGAREMHHHKYIIATRHNGPPLLAKH